MPSEAATQMDAAVVSPRTSSPWRRMLPAPRNPTPVTIWAAMRVGSTVLAKSGMKPRPVNMHDPALIKAMVRRPAGWPRNSRSAPMRRPRPRAIITRMASSTSPDMGVVLAPAGATSGPVLSAGFVLRTRLVRKLGEVQAVHEVSKNGEAFLVDDRVLGLVLVAVDLIRLRNDAGGLHNLGGDEDRALDAHRKRDRIGGTGVEVEVAAVLLDIEARVEDLVCQSRDNYSPDADAQVAERGGHEVVGQGPAQRVAGDLGRDGLRLERTDPDRQVAVGFFLFEDHQVLGSRHVYPNAVHGHLDEVFHPRLHITLRSSASLLFERPGPLRVTPCGYVESERGEGTAWAGDPDRRPQPHLPGFFCPAADEHVRRPRDQRRLRLHVDARDSARLASRVRDRRVRSRQTHISLRGVRGVQSGTPGHARRPAPSAGDGPRRPRVVLDPHLRRRGVRGRRRHRDARA